MEKTEGRNTKITNRKSRLAEKQASRDSPNQARDQESMTALKKQIKRLEAENKNLRQQIAALSACPRQPAQSYSDSVREQQHNFFKYSNARRY
jgi:predicted RNase H-like nuclease (RuvC/YqgF family)